jgi:hypothetical protein
VCGQLTLSSGRKNFVRSFRHSPLENCQPAVMPVRVPAALVVRSSRAG